MSFIRMSHLTAALDRPSPKSAFSAGGAAVATPEQLRHYLDVFSSDLQSPAQQAGADAGMYGQPYAGFNFPMAQAQDQQGEWV